MRILIISRTAWRKDNSFGNTYSSIFSKLDDVQIANICLADGMPDFEPNVTDYFIVPENQIKSSLFNRKKVGYRLTQSDIIADDHKVLPPNPKISVPRLPIFYMFRDCIWKFGSPNTKAIIEFAKEFDPDIIFVPLYYAKYVSRIALKIQKELKLPMVLEASIDVYSMKQLSFDPFFWLNRLGIRHIIRKISKSARLLYVITDKMKRDYQKYLPIPVKTLYKFPDTARYIKKYTSSAHKKLLFVYTGNIGGGRWKILSALASALKSSQKGELYIYTGTPISKQIDRALNINGISVIKGYGNPSEIIRIQSEADVLVHCEPFDIKSRLNIRYSISTKIMDYLCTGRTILAIGPKDIASMEFLNDNNLALCVTKLRFISDVINRLSDETLKFYSEKGINFIQKEYNLKTLSDNFINDLKEVALNNEFSESSIEKSKCGFFK